MGPAQRAGMHAMQPSQVATVTRRKERADGSGTKGEGRIDLRSFAHFSNKETGSLLS